jgi:hypothetical protein
MPNIISFAGVPLVVILSVVLAVGIEVVLLAGIFHLIRQGVASAIRDHAIEDPGLAAVTVTGNRQDSAR